MHAESYRNLDRVRQQAETDREQQYSSSAAREAMKVETQKRTQNKTPKWYQADPGEAFLLGMDVILASATGSGKTLAFLQALLADKTETTKLVIISPLNELEYDMTDRCNAMGLPALAVNGDMWKRDNTLHKKLLDHQFRVILTSPEMIFGHPVFSKMMRNSEWTKKIIGTVIDEAHCVLEWKDKFRTAFGEIEKARSYLPGKPIFAASATLTPSMIDSLISTLSLTKGNTFILNVGNDRANITPIICRTVASDNDFEALEFLLDEVDEDRPLIRTMVFFKTRDLARLQCVYKDSSVHCVRFTLEF
ncbi:P-loop containing nucleoside triphosphate hydrolase protein [Cytidiella melzeri]|nr:P-loop containing nucleoside triphosphate hydrolase protein [Cytidiella melzeri]